MTIAPLISQPTERTAPELRLVADRTAAAPSPVALSLTRRLQVALFDLGLDGLLPDGWANAEHDGIGFEPLSIRGADLLVRRLEDLARHVGETARFDGKTSEVDTEPAGGFDAELADGPDAEPAGGFYAEQLFLFDPTPYTVPSAALGSCERRVQP